MRDPNTYTPDWRVDVEPEQADDYDSTGTDSSDSSNEADTDDSDDDNQADDSESE